MEPVSVRYAESSIGFQLWIYDDYFDGRRDYTPKVISGPLGAQPAWLHPILDAAKAGGHQVPIPHPPPDHIMWFTIDRDMNLVEFTNE